MAYTKFSDYYTPTSGGVVSSASYINSETGIQTEFEDRMEATLLNGVVSGMAPSISTTNIAIAAGEAYCEGKRYAGSGTVSFVAKSAADYYVYIDPTDNTTPYNAKTGVPTIAELRLGYVTWDGSTTLSSLLDQREWGTVPWCARFALADTIGTGLVGWCIAPCDVWIEDVKIGAATAATGSSIIVDVHQGAAAGTLTSVWTTTSYRPTLPTSAGAFGVVTSTGYPEYGRKVSAGQVIAVYVDQTDSNSAAQDLEVVVRGRIYGKSS